MPETFAVKKNDAFDLTILISKQGLRGRSLSTFLKSLPEINTLYSADSTEQAGRIIDSNPAASALVAIDAWSIVGSPEALIQQIKERLPAVRCLLMVEPPQEEDLYRRSGADAVVLLSLSAARFEEALRNLTEPPAVSEGEHPP